MFTNPTKALALLDQVALVGKTAKMIIQCLGLPKTVYYHEGVCLDYSNFRIDIEEDEIDIFSDDGHMFFNDIELCLEKLKYIQINNKGKT